MGLDWEYCRIFYHVAQCRNFSRAARLLFTSQPAVSRAMKLLEHELGCRLFVRGRRGVELTPEGLLFYNYVESCREQLHKGRDAVMQSVGLRSGRIALGTSSTALQGWLLDRLERFHRTYPGVSIRIFNGSSRAALEELKSGAIDFGVMVLAEGTFRSFAVTHLTTFRDVFVAGPEYAYLKGREISLQELAALPLICLGTGSLTYDFLEGFFRDRGVDMVPAMEIDGSELILSLAMHGLGVGFVPERAAASAISEGKVFPLRLKEKLPERYICLVEHEGHALSLAAGRLRDMLLEQTGLSQKV